MEATTTAFPHIDSDSHRPVKDEHIPHSAVPSPASSPPHHLASLDRDSALTLGVLLYIILLAIVWVTHTRIKRRRAHSRDLEQMSSSGPGMGIVQRRIFRVDRKDSGQLSEGWPGQTREVGDDEDQRGHVMTLLKYESQRMDGVRATSQARRDRRWGESVAAHGSTVKADREEQEFPPLPPSPTLSSISSDDRAFRPIYHPLSRASAYTNPRECSIVGHDWMPFPRSYIPGLERPERIEGFRGVAGETEDQFRSLDDGAMPSVPRNAVTVDPRGSASISQDWVAGKV